MPEAASRRSSSRRTRRSSFRSRKAKRASMPEASGFITTRPRLRGFAPVGGLGLVDWRMQAMILEVLPQAENRDIRIARGVKYREPHDVVTRCVGTLGTRRPQDARARQAYRDVVPGSPCTRGGRVGRGGRLRLHPYAPLGDEVVEGVLAEEHPPAELHVGNAALAQPRAE